MSINQLITGTFICAQIKIIRFQNTAQKNKAPGDGENDQRWSRGHKARGQGQGQGHKKNPRPRPRPRTAFPRTDTLEAKDRNARGQGPRTQPQVLSKKKKLFKKFFQAISNLKA